ncbi:hypothetical protein NQ315_014747 [Exocentrus adspersus]|uniref:DDE Tnp4 domain-containing protein n=1 Tax=Exocentrus adspersus TaxID=1586481 RepID=A0AAV8VE41_9CUCU|nr:hypothetical protein NQ315_014747 [Exocentrus adspersus]
MDTVGRYQTTVGQDLYLAISQPVVSRIINKISHMFAVHLLPRYVKFPTTNEEIMLKKQRFMDNLNFPNTIGAIDGTQIAVVPPKVDDGVNPAVLYINRKGYHSINVHTIFDADMLLLNVNARYPGSTHDAAIWEIIQSTPSSKT